MSLKLKTFGGTFLLGGKSCSVVFDGETIHLSPMTVEAAQALITMLGDPGTEKAAPAKPAAPAPAAAPKAAPSVPAKPVAQAPKVAPKAAAPAAENDDPGFDVPNEEGYADEDAPAPEVKAPLKAAAPAPRPAANGAPKAAAPAPSPKAAAPAPRLAPKAAPPPPPAEEVEEEPTGSDEPFELSQDQLDHIVTLAQLRDVVGALKDYGCRYQEEVVAVVDAYKEHLPMCAKVINLQERVTRACLLHRIPSQAQA
jgi:hypothetical protein